MDLQQSLVIANITAKGNKVSAGGPGSGRHKEDSDDFRQGETVHHKDQFGNEIGEAKIHEIDKTDSKTPYLIQHTKDGSKLWVGKESLGRGMGKIGKTKK